MSLRIRPPPSRSASDSDSSFRKPAVPARANGSSLKRAFAGHDSDSGGDSDSDRRELVDTFDQREAERRRTRTDAPLVIAPLPNRDWRAVANARKVMREQTGAPESPGPAASRDTLNGGPVQAGLIKREPREAALPPPSSPKVQQDEAAAPPEDEDEDARARRLLIESLTSDGTEERPTIGAIASSGNDWMLSRTPQNETEAYRIDVETRPDVASLDDYERVPIEQFGAAMLRGMGWSANSANNVQPYLPQQRPSLLGIGAKERAPDDIPTKPGVKVRKGKPDMKYMPLVKKERESGSASSSRVASRSSSPTRAVSRRSPSPHSRRRDDGTDSDSRRDRDRDRRRDSKRDFDDRRDRGRDDDRARRSEKDDYDRDRRRRDDRDYDRSRDRNRDGSSRR